MRLGNLGETMRKIIFSILTLLSVALSAKEFAEYDPEQVFELKQRVVKTLPSIDGWCSVEKAMHFIDLVLEVRPKVCVEIGVFGGSSIFPVASTLKFLGEGLVVGIDPWDRLECIRNFDPVDFKAHYEWWSKVNLDAVYISYLNMIKRYGLKDYCLTLRASSESAATEIGTIDILYLDGNHSAASTEQDVQLYLPKVRAGGYIWLNDSLWDQSQSAIDILYESCDIVRIIDKGNCILFKKR